MGDYLLYVSDTRKSVLLITNLSVCPFLWNLYLYCRWLWVWSQGYFICTQTGDFIKICFLWGWLTSSHLLFQIILHFSVAQIVTTYMSFSLSLTYTVDTRNFLQCVYLLSVAFSLTGLL